MFQLNVLTCVGDSEGEHLPAVLVLASKLPEDIVLPFSGKPVAVLGSVQNGQLAESIGDLNVGRRG